MKTIILTGKSGSGKSFIASNLAQELSAAILDLDAISHQTLKLDKVKDFVKQTFGENVFDSNNEINRKSLGSFAFSNPQKLEMLNGLCEIEMINIIDDKLKNLKSEYVILEYLFLPQMKYFDNADVKILVKAEKDIRKKRILKRDGISSDYYEKREQNSIEFDDNKFDLIIQNNDNVDIKEIAKKIKAEF